MEKWKYLANMMSCVFLIFSVVTNLSFHHNVCGGENNFFIDFKTQTFQRSHYDTDIV